MVTAHPAVPGQGGVGCSVPPPTRGTVWHGGAGGARGSPGGARDDKVVGSIPTGGPHPVERPRSTWTGRCVVRGGRERVGRSPARVRGAGVAPPAADQVDSGPLHRR